jgi:hypothetical protein
MSWMGRRPLVGAYVCPRGVYAVEFKRSGRGYAIARSFEAAGVINTFEEAADRIVDALRAAGIPRADVAVAVRGFGVVHHVLQMPPAPDDILNPVVEREMRRLEPQLGDSIVSWISLPALRELGPEAQNHRSLLAVGAPTAFVKALQDTLRRTSYRLLHVTALPVGMQRVFEEFETGSDASGLITPLPDGAFLGFALDGALRLVIEPPLPQDPEHEMAALAEEAHLGVIFVRQQFRGVRIDHLSIAGTKHSLRDADEVFAEKVGIPVSRLGIRELSPAGYAALGAILDARSAAPLSLGGVSRERARTRAAASLDSASYAAIAIALVLAGFTAVQAFRSRDASDALRDARSSIQRDSLALVPIRSVASRRRAANDAAEAMRLSAVDRLELQQALAGIAYAVKPPVRLDTLQLQRSADGWSTALAGQVVSETSARAVQWLHDLYREIPRRLPVDSVRLDLLTYDEVPETDATRATVRFQLSFEIMPRTRGRD